MSTCHGLIGSTVSRALPSQVVVSLRSADGRCHHEQSLPQTGHTWTIHINSSHVSVVGPYIRQHTRLHCVADPSR
jgi:hypothetical protein